MGQPDPLDQLVPVPAEMVGPLVESLGGHVMVLLNQEIQQMGDKPGDLTAASVYKVLKDFEVVFQMNLASGAKSKPGERDQSVSGNLRRAFEKLKGDIYGLPWDKMFSEQQVKKFVKRFDGFQQHLVSPEFALRALIREALEAVKPLAQHLVSTAHTLLLEGARLSAIDAQYVGMGQRATMGNRVGKVSRFPMLENEMMPVITRTLETYHRNASELAETMVEMERECVTVAFFRKLQFSRLQRAVILLEREEFQAGGAPADAVLKAANGAEDDAESDEGSDDEGSAVNAAVSSQLEALNTPEKLQRQNLRKQPGFFEPLSRVRREEWREERPMGNWMLGVLRKRAHEARSGRFRTEKGKWQTRFFAYSDDTRELYYWKSIPANDDKARADLGAAQIYIPNCIVKQVAQPEVVFPNLSQELGMERENNQQFPRIFQVSSKVSGGFINQKGHRHLFLMTHSGSAMYQWTARLSNTSSDPRQGERAAIQVRQTSMRSEDSDSPAAGKVNPLKVAVNGGEDAGGEKEVENDPSLPRTPTGTYEMGDLGLGSHFFDAEELRWDGRLRPAPVHMLRPAKDIARGKGLFYKTVDGSGNISESERGEMVLQMGLDAKAYTMAICDSLQTNLPKVVMWEQVDRAERELSSSLQGEFLGLSQDRQNQLLTEDSEMDSRRAMAVHCREDINDLLDKLRDPGPEDDKDKGMRRVPAKALVLTGLSSHPVFPRSIKGRATPKQLVEALYGQLTPQALLQSVGSPSEALKYYLDEVRRRQRRAQNAENTPPTANGQKPGPGATDGHPPVPASGAAHAQQPPPQQPGAAGVAGQARRPQAGPPNKPAPPRPGAPPPNPPLQASGPSLSRRPAPGAPGSAAPGAAAPALQPVQRRAPPPPVHR